MGRGVSVTVPYPRFTSDEPCAAVGVEMMYRQDNDSRFGDRFEVVDWDVKRNMPVNYSLDVASVVCAGCPMLGPCGEWGMAHEEYGVWGGMTATARARLRREIGQELVPILASDYVDDLIERRLRPELFESIEIEEW